MPLSAGNDRPDQLPDMVSIHVRQPEVTDRMMSGHRERDLIKGSSNKSCAGVLVERMMRLPLLAWMPDATAEAGLAGFTTELNSITEPMLKHLTYDRGKEMARQWERAINTKIRGYSCEPYKPWQRGSRENTNGPLRQMLPKSTDLSVHDQESLDTIADLLNDRPQENLDWRSPIQAFRKMMHSVAEQDAAAVH